MRTHLLSFSRLVLLLVPAVILVAQTQHITPFTGTWKLNKAKSNLPPGEDVQSRTLRMTEDGRTTVSATDNKGNSGGWSYAWSDGKEVPAEPPRGAQNATVTQTIQGQTGDVTVKVAGKTTMTVHMILAADGKSHTDTVTYIDSQGQRSSHIEFYDKQ